MPTSKASAGSAAASNAPAIKTHWLKQLLRQQAFRYLVNGGVATVVHFLVLTFNLRVLDWESAGLSNIVAAVCGTIVSFLGNRYYVFHGSTEPLFKQIYRFSFIYVAIAMGHGLILYVWSDVYRMNYIFGFMLATVFQVACSYSGNKLMVFKV
jgi:putative flippase GtrA